MTLTLHTPSRVTLAYADNQAALMRRIAIVLANVPQHGISSSACAYCGTVWCHCGGQSAQRGEA